MAENGVQEPVIGVAFDGTGYGEDGQIWGGEFLVGDFQNFERRAHLKYVVLPGGEAAIRKPYRIAFSHPSVEGILMWGFWEDSHWRSDAYIVDSNWTLNAAGIRYESIMDEWTTNDSAVTDGNGSADFRGFYGTYSVTLTLDGADPTVTTIEMTPDGPNEFVRGDTERTSTYAIAPAASRRGSGSARRRRPSARR